jgi:hypothetical protein
MVWSAGVSSDAGVVVMGTVGATTLTKVAPSSSEESSRVASKDVTRYAPFLRKWRLSPPLGERDLGGQGDQR